MPLELIECLVSQNESYKSQVGGHSGNDAHLMWKSTVIERGSLNDANDSLCDGK